MPDDFDGAKLALVHGDAIVVILRDDNPGILYPDMWDFAGGAREGAEGPEETALRETREELGLVLTEDRLIWSCREESNIGQPVWCFAAEIAKRELSTIRLGDEGQCWKLMAISDFLSNPRAIPSLKRRLRLYLAWCAQNRCPT